MKKIRKCAACGSYTMSERCPADGGETRSAHPPKYSPLDRYARYRRQYKFSKRK